MPNWRKRTVVGLVVCLLHLSLADWEAVMKRGIKTLLILPLQHFHLLCSVLGAKKEALAVGGGNGLKGGLGG